MFEVRLAAWLPWCPSFFGVGQLLKLLNQMASYRSLIDVNKEFSPIPDVHIYIYISFLFLQQKKRPNTPRVGTLSHHHSQLQSAPEAFFPAFVGIRICMFATFLNNIFGLHLPLLVFVVVFCCFLKKNPVSKIQNKVPFFV